MEEVQSWWEVPAVAHFCCIFRETFNLIYFDVAELEAAILNMQDPEMSVSIEQLITKLLQGCFKDGEVTSVNLEEKLSDIFEEHCEDEENPLNGGSFHFLTPRSKVEMLLKLCQIRLDIAASLDAIKDIPAEDMQAKCIGKDSQNYSYWYFSDERLYKEIISKTSGKGGKQSLPEKSKKKDTRPIKNGRRESTRDKKNASSKESDVSWSIVCRNLNDWEKLAQKFSKSKSTLEKELAKEIKDNCLPLIEGIIAEKERLLRKRYIELAPKRTSSRISKVQAQRKMEEQRIAEEEETRRREYEIEQKRREILKKQQEKEERSKRVEERSKIIADRARRAQQRGMMRNFIDDYDDSNSNDHFKKTLRNRSGSSNHIENGDDSDALESSDASESESDNDSDKSERQSSSEEEETNERKSSSEEEESESDAESSEHCENDDSASTNTIDNRQFVHTYDLTQWRSSIDTKGQKMHFLKSPSSDISERKRFRVNEAGNYMVSPLNDCNSTSYKENQPFQVRNYNTYNAAARQAIVRIDFIKPPNKQVSS